MLGDAEFADKIPALILTGYMFPSVLFYFIEILHLYFFIDLMRNFVYLEKSNQKVNLGGEKQLHFCNSS